MKIIFGLIMIVVCTQRVKAQNKDMFKNKPWEQAKQKMFLRDSLSRLYTAPSLKSPETITDDKGVLQLPLKGKFLGKNGKDNDIYAMQKDNMPCLVPGKNFHSNMPVVGFDNNKNLLPLLKKEEEKLEAEPGKK